MKRRSALLALLCLLTLSGHVFAQGHGNGNGNNGKGSDNSHDDSHGNNGNGNKSDGETGAERPPRPSTAPVVELSESAALQAVQTGKAVSLQSLLPDVEARTGGEIINAQLQQVRGSLIYTIKVLTPDGKVMTEYYHARSGLHVE